MRLLPMIALALLTIAASTLAQSPATTAPATAPASQPAAFLATDKDALTKAAGAAASVTGTVSRTNWYNDEILFINFKDTQRGDFTVIARQENRTALDKAFDGDIAKTLDGKKITVTGTIVLYRGHPEIIVTKPDQITLLPAPETPTTDPAK
ncbi:MAG: hypothetical protein ACTHN5_24115 [Phycisphaerae bacterium]